MKYKEAEDLLYQTKWKTKTCSQGKKCWCRMIVPVKKIKCDIGELFIASSGELTKRAAKYFVKLHNKNLE